jgi:hypothetical protein
MVLATTAPIVAMMPTLEPRRDARGVSRATMDRFIYTSENIVVARRGADPSASWYVVCDERDSLTLDAYVLDFELSDNHPTHFAVILFSTQAGLPSYVYSPADMEGLAVETVLRLAIVAYRTRYADLLDLWQATGLVFDQSARDLGPEGR